MGGSRCDVLVVGGGVCGLWTLWSLLEAGYDAWLLERSALGDGQTIASQGILHAGAKYRLPGNAVDASRAVAEVQEIWCAGLGGGAGAPDLARVRVLSRRTLLWTTGSVGSRLAAAGASRVMRSGVERVERGAWPAGFGGAGAGVELFETPEMVLDPASLVEVLRDGVSGRARVGRVIGLGTRDSGVVVELEGGDRVACDALVLTAGAGNEGLIGLAGGKPGLMQRRPLHQVVAIGAPFDLHGHCLQLSLDKPALTVTTGELAGERTWYLGGGPAEEGVGRSREDQIGAARAALARCLPWVDLSGVRFETFLIDRAEGEHGGKRPDDAVAVWAREGVLAVWPTKLVLAPRAATQVLDRLRERGIRGGGGRVDEALRSLAEPGVAARVW
jgi:glycine/D-amino acid oxidase-like deaminating enzyme